MLVIGCGPVPQPFRVDTVSKQHAPALFPAEAMGIAVSRIGGPVPWVGDALAEAMAESLRDREVAASAKARNRLSLALSSEGHYETRQNGVGQLVIDWRLTARDGTLLGQRTDKLTPPEAFWHAPEQQMFKQIAESGAPAVVAWLRPYLIGSTITGPLTVAIAPVHGAPGNGNTALQAALHFSLRQRRVALTESLDTAEVTVFADAKVTPVDKTRDRVQLSWQLLARDGQLIGSIDQDNFVRSGRLNQRWGGIAVVAADAAADGVAILLRQLAQAMEARRQG